jgi:hypothetical protein
MRPGLDSIGSAGSELNDAPGLAPMKLASLVTPECFDLEAKRNLRRLLAKPLIPLVSMW